MCKYYRTLSANQQAPWQHADQSEHRIVTERPIRVPLKQHYIDKHGEINYRYDTEYISSHYNEYLIAKLRQL